MKKINFTLLTLLVFTVFFVIAEDNEYFGVFSGEPSFIVKTNNDGRPTFILLDSFTFTDPNGFKWEAPKNWEVDGASIPQLAWSLVGGPMSGKYIHASVIHDRYCELKNRTAHDTHRNFYYGMKANGVSEVKASLMYWAVRTFGPSWKVLKEPVNSYEKTYTLSGVGPDKQAYLLKVVEVSPPNMSEESITKLLKQIEPGMSLKQLESLSDKVRSEYGAERLQRVEPRIKDNEVGARVKIPELWTVP